jgi:nucleoid-associated protein YgaU
VEGVVVRRGDTLWSIAARHLEPTAAAADINIAWHQWFAANREVIGDDPGLILPGQLLSPPRAPQGRS